MKRFPSWRFLAITCLLVPLCACDRPAQTSVEQKPGGVPVRATRADRRDIPDVLVLTGNLRPRAQVQIVAEVSARLVRILRDEGARVSKGDVIAELDVTDYALAQDRAKAGLDVAEANRAHAVVENDRAGNLLETGGITDKDHLAAQVTLQVATAALAQARAEAAIARVQLERCRVTAVFDGRVAKRLADPGAMLAAGTPIVTLVDDSVLEFRAAVPSSDYAKVRIGATADVTVDDLPGFAVSGTVARMTPLVDERSRAFDVIVEVPGHRDLVGGLFARASIRVGSVTGAIVVPPTALIRDGALPRDAHLFVVKDGRAERRAVTIGVESPELIQVAEGIEAGDTVVLDPPVALSSGARVDVKGK